MSGRANRHRHEWVYFDGKSGSPRDLLRRCETCGAFQQFWDDDASTAQGWTDVDPRYLP